MGTPIFKVFLAKPHAALMHMPLEERQLLLARIDAALAEAGGTRVLFCDASWSSDQWQIAGVEQFPNIEAVQQFTAALNQFNWFQYFEGISVLGTPWGEPG